MNNNFVTGEIFVKDNKLVEMNDGARCLLDISKDDEYEKLLKDDILLLFDFESRKKYFENLNEISDNQDIFVNDCLVDSHGKKFNVVGWMRKENDLYHFIYLPSNGNNNYEDLYYKTLVSAYNFIFRVDLVNDSVICIHGSNNTHFEGILDIKMSVISAKEYWIKHVIVEEDREMMRDYFNRISTKGYIESSHRPLQANFAICTNDNAYIRYTIVAVAMSDGQELIGLRDISKVKYTEDLTDKLKLYRSVKDHYARVLSTSACGIACIRVNNDKITLLSTYSDNDIFNGIVVEEIINKEVSIDFVSKRLSTSRETIFEAINSNDKVEVTIEDKKYLVEFRNDDLIDKSIFDLYFYNANQLLSHKVFIRTFGYFDVFVDDKAISFTNSKEKELLALLVDRNGGVVTSDEAITYLFDGINDEKTRVKYRKTAMFMYRDLEKYGIENIIINDHGSRSINTTLVECDYYELLRGNPKYKEMFADSYMLGYEWAFETFNALLVLTSEK